MRVAFAGTPEFALPPLAALRGAHQVVGVLTQPDRPAGRGRLLAAGPVKQSALDHGEPLMQPQGLRGADNAASLATTLATLRQWQPDVLVVVAYGLILPPSVLVLPRMGCLNIHASLLPRWRGAAPIQRAILAGDETTGVSIMQMDAGLDTGDVLLQAPLRIDAQMIAGELHDHLATLGAAQILVALQGLASGQLQPQPQAANGVTHAAKLSKDEARVDWDSGAIHIDRQIRAFNPWPVAEARLHGEPVRLLRSRVAPAVTAAADAPPGTVIGLANDALEVVCGQGVLQVLQLQRAGRRPVSARDFLNAGRQGKASASLVFA
ncbi:MAG: methionyl-tRNA formyltransferase [Pseudomonadota bacterium]